MKRQEYKVTDEIVQMNIRCDVCECEHEFKMKFVIIPNISDGVPEHFQHLHNKVHAYCPNCRDTRTHTMISERKTDHKTQHQK